MATNIRRPWWLAIVIIALMTPLLLFPSLVSQSPADSMARMLIWFYPAYVIATGICAWLCWPERKMVTWILLILLVLTHAGMYVLVDGI